MFKRDHYTCQYCGVQPGGEELTIDHVVPRSQGGTSTWENCVLACVTCNKRKADRTPQQAGLKLRQAAGSPDVEADVRPTHGPDRKLVEVRQRGVLEREVGESEARSSRTQRLLGFTRVCSWESKRSPKPPYGVRILALVLIEPCRRGSTEKGAGLVNRLMLVQIQSSAL